MSARLLEDATDDDPLLSVVNLIDVFLVLVAALLLAVAGGPGTPFVSDQVTIIRHAGTPEMEIVVREGSTVTHYRADGSRADGAGVRVGAAYRLSDGTIVYVPDP